MKKFLLIIFVFGFAYFAILVSDEMGRQNEEKSAMLRDNFKNLVIYRTPDQVIANVGKPTTTQQAGKTEYWNYHHATKDPITGKLDSNAQVVIDDGKVRDVNF